MSADSSPFQGALQSNTSPGLDYTSGQGFSALFSLNPEIPVFFTGL
jgi:hypothetical protein